MESTYGEFSGTDLDLDADLDFEDEGNDLMPILGLSAGVAAVVGAILVLAGRRRKQTPIERMEAFLGDVGKEAGKQGKKGAKAVQRTVKDAKLGDLLSDAMDRAGKATGNVDLGDFANDVKKRARKLTRDVQLSSLLGDALDQAQKAGKRVGLDERTRDVKKKVESVVASVPHPDVDTKGLEGFLEALKERIGGTIDAVRTDVAPAAQSAASTVAQTLRDDVLPAAQGAVEKVREDVLPAAEKGLGSLFAAGDVSKRARTAASSAGQGAGIFSDLARGLAATVVHKVIQDVLPAAGKMGGKVANSARHDVLPGASKFASQTPDLVGTLIGMARSRVEDALTKAVPVAGDAAEFGKHRLGDFATFTRHRAGDVAGSVGGSDGIASTVGRGVGGAAASVGQGVAGAASTVGRGVGNVVGGTVGATTYVTRETGRILFWLAMLGGLILLAFVPEKDRQKEIVNGIMQFAGEVREMWTDLQGPDDDDSGEEARPV